MSLLIDILLTNFFCPNVQTTVGGRGVRPEYGDIYRDISIGVNIEGFQAYCCIGVTLWGKFGTKYCWCCIGSSKLIEIFFVDFVGVYGSCCILRIYETRTELVISAYYLKDLASLMYFI